MIFYKKLVLAGLLMASAGVTHAESFQDLSSWQNDGTGVWVYDSEANAWTQTENSTTGSFLYGGETDAIGMAITGDITVNTTADDDWIGFALGYDAGDDGSADADYFLLTWKKSLQGNADAGLTLWHVSGTFSESALWSSSTQSYYTEILSASTLSDVGWESYTTYTFDLTYQNNAIGIFINDSLEYAVTPGDVGLTYFEDGGFAFFNFSQPDVVYSSLVYGDVETVITTDKQDAIATEVPLFGSTAALAFASLFGFRQRKRND